MGLSMNTVADCLQRHYRVVVFAVYLAVVIVTMAFHEPWFDEAQSWLIARDCPYRDLLLVRPHYEGHPPLWWLLLSIPAKLGVPYEWGLKGVELVCSALMCGLLVFRAPLPRLAVALLPFTYFLCYQYGVTSRPYALMCCALFVIAACWKSRDEHPWRLTAAFVLLCCTSSYGIALACAFALVWMVRAIRGATGRPAVRDGLFGNPARFAAWMVLLAVGLVLTACVLPRSDTFGAVQDPGGNPPIAQFALFWTVLPAESMFTAFAGDVSLHGLHMGVLAIALCVALLPSLVWTAAAIACDIRYDYSAGRALATFVRNNNLEHDRWVSFWRYLPDTTWPDGTHTNRMEDTHRYSWPAIAANPYFARNLLDCTYEGRTFVPNQVPSRAQMNREIASCAAEGAPEFLIGDTDFPQYFFHRLGLKRGDYRQIVVASQHVPWKTWVTSSDIAVYVRSDVYRTLPHA